MRRLLIFIFGPLALVLSALVLAAGPAAAVSPHFVSASVTGITSNTITVSFKESGLGNSLNSVTITVNGTAVCVNGGGNHPKASNKEAFSVSGVFGVSNGTATGSETLSAATISPPCSPPQTICWTGLSVTDAAFSDVADIPGTFCPSG